MVLSKKDIEIEIKASEETIKKMEKGIEIHKIVLKSFKQALEKCPAEENSEKESKK